MTVGVLPHDERGSSECANRVLIAGIVVHRVVSGPRTVYDGAESLIQVDGGYVGLGPPLEDR